MISIEQITASNGIAAVLEEPEETQETETVNPWELPLTVVCARDADDDDDVEEDDEDFDYFSDDDDEEDFDEEFDDDLEEEELEEEEEDEA